MITVVDSSVILSLTLQEPGAETAARAMAGARLSTVNAAEVLTRLIDGGFSESQADEALGLLGLTIVPFDMAQARIAADLRKQTRHRGLSLGDRACLALAIHVRAKAVTADRAWGELDVGIPIEVIR